FAYRTVLYTTFGTGVLSFTVWAHHQFIARIDPRMAHVFTITTLLISIPIAEMMFVFIATLYGGDIRLTTPMLWAIAIIGVYAGVTFWYPKMFGRMMSDTLGKIHFWLTIIPFNCIFIPLFFLGLAGQHRRIYDFTNFPELAQYQPVRVFAASMLIIMLIAQLIFIINFFWSLRRGKDAGPNPWKSNTLEWTTDSPPGHGNWKTLPTVYRGPYEYNVP